MPVSAMALLPRIGSCWPARLCAVVAKRRLFGSLPHAAHGGGTGAHGGDDVVVARAAAQVALEALAHRVLVEIAALAGREVDGGHDHAGGAEAALQAVVLAERLLHGMQLAVDGEALE